MIIDEVKASYDALFESRYELDDHTSGASVEKFKIAIRYEKRESRHRSFAFRSTSTAELRGKGNKSIRERERGNTTSRRELQFMQYS
eukprot:scaffold27090_cov77-Skeletonema_dohrnii-CCMP3373.AAC.1